MPDTRALQELVRLWDRYQVTGERAREGFGPWFDLFRCLRELRAWGPWTAFPRATIDWLTDRLERTAGSVRAESRALELPEQ